RRAQQREDHRRGNLGRPLRPGDLGIKLERIDEIVLQLRALPLDVERRPFIGDAPPELKKRPAERRDHRRGGEYGVDRRRVREKMLDFFNREAEREEQYDGDAEEA